MGLINTKIIMKYLALSNGYYTIEDVLINIASVVVAIAISILWKYLKSKHNQNN